MKPYLILLLAISVAIGFPRFSQQGYSYQNFLWTSEWMKAEYPSSGFRFEFGRIDDALMWNRVRLGFPLGATTIDSRFSDHVLQGRVETTALLFNVLILGFPASILLGFLTVARRIRRSNDHNQRRGEQDGGGNSAALRASPLTFAQNETRLDRNSCNFPSWRAK
jgi:hypothetical protein